VTTKIVEIHSANQLPPDKQERSRRAFSRLETIFGPFSQHSDEHFAFACNYLLSCIVNDELRVDKEFNVDAWFEDFKNMLDQMRAVTRKPVGPAQ
jgi:hypothetical protein